MKRSIGYFMVLAAVILIVCSATTLFWSAYESAVEPWQKWVQGVQIVAVIGWEAGAILAIAYCWRHKFYLIAIGGSALLMLAAAYTLSGEMRLQAGTQENSVARKSAESGKIELVRSELDKAIKRRDLLQAQRRLTEDQREELAELRKDIADLKGQWAPLVEETSAVGIPGAAMIARWTGLNVNDSGDIDALIKMAFWTMVRVFALPLAVFGMMAAGQERKEARTAAKASEGSSVTPVASPAVLGSLTTCDDGIWTQIKVEPRPDLARKLPAPETDPLPPGDAAPPPRAPITPTIEPQLRKPELATDGGKRLTKAERKRRAAEKAERAASERIAAVEAFCDATLEIVPLNRGVKGSVISGGTEGLALRKKFREWAKTRQQWSHLHTVNDSHLGRAFNAVLDAGKDVKGSRYGAVMKVKQPVRRAA